MASKDLQPRGLQSLMALGLPGLTSKVLVGRRKACAYDLATPNGSSLGSELRSWDARGEPRTLQLPSPHKWVCTRVHDLPRPAFLLRQPRRRPALPRPPARHAAETIMQC